MSDTNTDRQLDESAASVDQFRLEFASVLRSYNAMETTKRRHFDYMSMLEDKKKKFNLAATPEESQTLAALLRDHNDEVVAFKERSDSLKTANPIAHQAFFEYIGRLNRALAPAGASSGH